MGEFDLIATIKRITAQRDPSVVIGIGDDAAVLEIPRARQLVVSMDTLHQGVHFPANTLPEDLGWKALAVNLSDLAAMGAKPAWTTLSLSSPKLEPAWLKRFLAGFNQLAKRHDVALVGGDTTRGPLSITIQAHGFVARGKAISRGGAQIGDLIYVSGDLGDASAALRFLKNPSRKIERAVFTRLKQRLDRPQPRIALGMGLAGYASSMIDVSDGLAQDLGHILAQSELGADIEASRLPTSKPLLAAILDAPHRWPLQLTGGDDYELCFTAAPRHQTQITQLAKRLKTQLTCIGQITKRRGLRIYDDGGKTIALKRTGYRHF